METNSQSAETSGQDAAALPPEALNKTTVLKCHSEKNPHSAEQLIHIVGTAHVSQKSCKVVQSVIQDVKPEVWSLHSSLRRRL